MPAAPAPLPPTQAEMDAMVIEARERGSTAHVRWHALHWVHSGGGRDDCPFGADEPEFQKKWLWMFDLESKNMASAGVAPPVRPAPSAPKAKPAGPHITKDGKFKSDRFKIIRLTDGADVSLDKIALSLHDTAAREPLVLYARRCADRELGRDLLALLGAEGR